MSRRHSLVPFILALSLATMAAASEAPPLVVSGEDGVLLARSADGAFQWRLDGRIQLDTAYYSEDDVELSDGAEARRARLAVKTVLWRVWSGELDVDFADDEPEVKDFWVAYDGFASSQIKVGHHKEPFSLEEVTSSRHLVFIERALPNVFAPGRHLGASYTRWGTNWRGSAGLYGQELSDVGEEGEDEGYGASGRLTFAPINDGETTVHLGLGVTRRTPDAGEDDRVRFRTRPETHVSRERFLNTGKIKDVDHYTALGVEAAAVFGRLHLQGEYIETEVARTSSRRDATLNGGYVMAAWAIAGERRPYRVDEGEFTSLVPNGRGGAWEVAARYSTLDLNDLAAGVEGGSAETTTLGVTWYANPNVRIYLNYVDVDHDRFADADGDLAGDQDYSFVQLRLQMTF